MDAHIWRHRSYPRWVLALTVAFLGYMVPFVHIVRIGLVASSQAQLTLAVVRVRQLNMCNAIAEVQLACGECVEQFMYGPPPAYMD